MKKIQAFTLVELLVVLLVISVLVGISLPVAKYATQRSKTVQYEVLMQKIKSALEDYRAKYGEYPITPSYKGVSNNKNDVLRHYPDGPYRTLCYYRNQETNTYPADFLEVDFDGSTTRERIKASKTTKEVDYALTYPLILRPLENGERPYLGDGEETLFTVLSLITATPPRKDRTLTIYSRTRSGRLRAQKGRQRYGWPINRHVILDPRSGKEIKYESNGIEYEFVDD